VFCQKDVHRILAGGLDLLEAGHVVLTTAVVLSLAVYGYHNWHVEKFCKGNTIGVHPFHSGHKWTQIGRAALSTDASLFSRRLTRLLPRPAVGFGQYAMPWA
jgi:hypothetical protein